MFGAYSLAVAVSLDCGDKVRSSKKSFGASTFHKPGITVAHMLGRFWRLFGQALFTLKLTENLFTNSCMLSRKDCQCATHHGLRLQNVRIKVMEATHTTTKVATSKFTELLSTRKGRKQRRASQVQKFLLGHNLPLKAIIEAIYLRQINMVLQLHIKPNSYHQTKSTITLIR